jgi:DNA-binding NtrC family response regulator
VKSTSNSNPGLLTRSASPLFRAFLDTLKTLAVSPATVLLSGEIGVGKTRAARRLHALSDRALEPLVEISLAAIAPTLMESELFGHERGAFTDAKGARLGCFRRAQRGTLVLEDIDAMPLETQVKLLRVIQERVVEPLGGDGPVPIDVRLVVATGSNLQRLVKEGKFREDLYYRLAVVPLEVPPLRARLEDLPVLVEQIVTDRAARIGVAERALDAAAMERLANFPWPGNVRELENALERALVLADARDQAELQADDFDFLDEALQGRGLDCPRSARARLDRRRCRSRHDSSRDARDARQRERVRAHVGAHPARA